MKSELMIYGVTGYTGRLISRTAAGAGLPHIAAARDLEAVQAHADPLLVPARAFSLNDPGKVRRALGDVAVVLNAAGPFAETALPLAEACLATATHYLDLSGEVPELEAMHRLDERARRAGIMLLPGAGFSVVPSDALAARLRRRLPTATHLRLACEAAGGVSRGSWLALLRDLERPGVKRRDGELVPARPAERQLRVDLGEGVRTTATDPWRGDLATAFWSAVIPNIDAYRVFPRPLRWALRARLAGPLLRRPAGRPVRFLLRRLANLIPPGPDERTLAAASTRIWVEVEDRSGQRLSARLRGPGPNLFSAYTSLWMARKVLAGHAPTGFQTPATAYGPDLIEHLRRDIPGLVLTETVTRAPAGAAA